MNPFLHLLTLRSAGYNESFNNHPSRFIDYSSNEELNAEDFTSNDNFNLSPANQQIQTTTTTTVVSDDLPLTIVIYCFIEIILSLHTAIANGNFDKYPKYKY